MSGNKEWLFRIQDMIEAISELQIHLEDISEEIFLKDNFVQKAVERYFEIIGEAARFVPKEIQNSYPEVVWADIIGIRHKISHDYLKVNPQVLWESYKRDLPSLKMQLEQILQKED